MSTVNSSCSDDGTLKRIVSDVLAGMEVLSVQAEPAVAAGEHYLSTLIRTHVEFRIPDKDTRQKTTLIIKTYPQGVLYDFVKDSHMLIKELITYEKIVPRINEIHDGSFTPNSLGCTRGDVLVLEDLQPKGFRTVNRVDKLDFEHAKQALETLADFHAASIVVHERNPELFDEMKEETLYRDDNKYMKYFVANAFNIVAERYQKMPKLKQYCEHLRNAGEKIWDSVKEAVKPKSYGTFCHGDFWTTNILFRYDDLGSVKEAKFIDFQFCRWSSPAFDLQMLYNTSIRNLKDIPKLTSIYLERLNSNLHPKTITAEELEIELRRLDCFGLLTAVCTLPICILDPKTPLDFSDTNEDDFDRSFPHDQSNPYLVALMSKGFLEMIPEYLEFYSRNGVL